MWESGDTVYITPYNFATDRFYGIEGYHQFSFSGGRGRISTNFSIFYDWMHGISPSGSRIHKEAFTGDLRSSVSWSFPKSGTSMQLSFTGNTPYKSPMQDVGGYFITGIGLSQKFLKKRLTASINASSISGEMKYWLKTRNTSFYSYAKASQNLPFVFSLSWSINGFRQNERANLPIESLIDKSGV